MEQITNVKPETDDGIPLQARVTGPLTGVVVQLRMKGYRDSEMVREGLRCLAVREHIDYSKTAGPVKA